MRCLRDLLGGLAALALAASLSGAEAPRVAVVDFSLAESAVSRDPAVTEFSRDVQARMLLHPEYAWIERQEFDRIQREYDFAGQAQSSSVSAVRLGHWLHADLLLRGEITRPTPGKGELTIEVIDLKRAELLATRKSPVTVNARNLVRPQSADVDAVAAAALAALKDAQTEINRNQKVRVIAPLYFRNVGPTERLNFIETRLTDAIAQAASGASGARVLRFPRATDASGESELVIAGLTDSDPEAWQRVADFYVWGTFSEGNSEGIAFDKVPVNISVQVWNGAGAPRDVRWEGMVRDLEQGLTSISSNVLSLTQERPPAAERTDSDRKRVVTELKKRAKDIQIKIYESSHPTGQTVSADFLTSPAGRNLTAYYRRLLDIACFLDPLNRELQWNRLTRQKSGFPSNPAEKLRYFWKELEEEQSFVRQFERLPDGSFDWEPHLTTAMILEDILEQLERFTARSVASGQESATMSPEENLRQFRAAMGLWSRAVAAANRPFANQSLPEGLRSCDKDRIDYLGRYLQRDAIAAHDALEQVWPWLKTAIGKDIHENPNSKWPENVISIYAAFGDVARASKLLDEAWNAAGVSPPKAAVASPSVMPGPSPAPEKPWQVSPQLGSGVSIPTGIALNASVRELDLWPLYDYDSPYRERPLAKRRLPGVTSLAWHQGELWVGQTVQARTSEAALPFASRNFLWRYDPALQSKELVTRGLQAHSAVRSVVSHGQQLWLGMDSEGVWRWSGGQADVHRYRGEDGLATPRIYGAAADQNAVFFAGGSREHPVVAYFSTDAGNWFALQAPSALRFGLYAILYDKLKKMLPYAPELAVSRNWVAMTTPIPAFFSVGEKTWSNLPIALGGQPASSSADRPCTTLSADSSGFWLGYTNMIVQFDPAAPNTAREIRLPGTPVAAAHDGARLWLVLESPDGNSMLALVDKSTAQCIGLLALPKPAAESLANTFVWDEDAVPTTHFNKIAIADGRVWIGGPGLLEVTVRGTPPGAAAGGSADHPLFRAAWRGDLPSTDVALAAKADVNESTASGWTPLLAAVDGGSENVVQALLRAGAQPNQLSRDGISPLELAATRGNLALVQILLAAGAKPDVHLPAEVHGLKRFWISVEPFTPNLDATVAPNQPENLHGRVTDGGSVVLSWEGRGDNVSVFKIWRCDVRGTMLGAIAEVPADCRTWADETPPLDSEVGYRVYAINGSPSGGRFEDAPALWVKVPKSDVAFTWADTRIVLPPIVESRTPLMAAASNGDLPVLQELLKAKASPDLRDPVGQTALLMAARAGHYEVVRALLAVGAQADVADATGRTAAQTVYERHDDEALWREMLLAVDATRRARETSRLVLLAAADGQLHDLETLRGLGATIDATSEFGDTALLRAIGRPSAVKWLLDHGFSVKKKVWTWSEIMNPAARTLEAAIKARACQDLATLLDAGFSVNESIEGLPLIALAAKLDKHEAVALLMERGADLNQKSNEGRLPASYAATEATKALFAPASIAKWALPDRLWTATCGEPSSWSRPDPAKESLSAQLIEACKKDDLDTADRAIQGGVPVDWQDHYGISPLYYALNSRAFRTARWLVEHGASVNFSSRGSFPLAWAIDAGDPQLAIDLLRAGADPDFALSMGQSPLMAACYADNLEIAARLLDAGADPNLEAWDQNARRVAPLAIALRKGNAAMVDLLLTHGANPRAQPVFIQTTPQGPALRLGQTLLMYAAAGGNVGLISKMITAGQDPRTTTWDGTDALAWASAQGNDDAVKLLLPLCGHSAHALKAALDGGHTSTVELLHQAGYQ
jgi:ankyrin repeat protein